MKNSIGNQIYKSGKQIIDDECKNLEYLKGHDLPLRRQTLNDLLNGLIYQVDFAVMKERITEKKGEQIKNWLTDYVIKNHEPKPQFYKVVKIGRKNGMSGRRQILERGLTESEAKRVVNSYPDSNRSMVVFTKQ